MLTTPELKTQTFGVAIVECKDRQSWHDMHGFFRERIGDDTYARAKAEALQAYFLARENGTEEDNPRRSFPQDGDYTFLTLWAQGERLKTCYTQGRRDAAWMAEKDENYLARLTGKPVTFMINPRDEDEKHTRTCCSCM